jgi:tRNA(Ile)-lysidine synthase
VPDRIDLAPLVRRCTFSHAGTAVACACSGGPDSSALVILAVAAGLDVTVHHVDHGLREGSAADVEVVRTLAERVGCPVVVHGVAVAPGGNQEARARDARRSVLPPGVLTGHTADDQAETVLLRLLRGNASGLAAMRPGPEHPLLGLRRHETAAVCAAHGIHTVDDPTNTDPAHLRNRVRHELLPLLEDIAGRDPVPLLARVADLVRDDDDLLRGLAAAVDAEDARAVSAAPAPLARRAVRAWLAEGGYPPDLAAVERVLAVASGARVACEIEGGRRVERHRQRLRVRRPGR